MEEKKSANNFIRTIINEDLKNGKHGGRVETRFPPEPNGYLHIGHAKSICLNFGIAEDYNGPCHLRFDDTNPAKESTHYINSIKDDIRWLGFDWGEHLYFASDYFDQLHQFAVQLIKDGKAYVCHLSQEEFRTYRGTLTKPGTEGPYRNRPIEESLELFEKMKNGEFEEGKAVLRAKIDMTSPNLNMRDPVLYRVQYIHHHRTGDKWCIYPMYDYTHPISDALEMITHSICTLEFEDHRPLYNWSIQNVAVPAHPQQIEFARLNITNTVMSKRKLLELVEENIVSGWDDPRMPTVTGLRRRGYTATSIRNFCDAIGVAKGNSIVDYALLEHFLREDLNGTAQRGMVVMDPLKVIIDNLPQGETIWLDGENNPQDESMGTRKIPFSRELYIEQTDFKESANRKFFRMTVGKEVRLKNAFYVKCVGVDKDEEGNIIAAHCTYDVTTQGGWSEDGRKVKGTLHWVSKEHAVDVEVRVYHHLFKVENPGEERDFKDDIDLDSLTILKNCKAEPMLGDAAPESHFQFLRTGYFVADRHDHSSEHPVFNQTVSLKSSYKPGK